MSAPVPAVVEEWTAEDKRRKLALDARLARIQPVEQRDKLLRAMLGVERGKRIVDTKFDRLTVAEQREILLSEHLDEARFGPVYDLFAARVADIAWRARGIVLDEWRCACGEPYSVDSYPLDRCRACKRPLPRRCTQPGCGTVIEPRVVLTNGDLLATAEPSLVETVDAHPSVTKHRALPMDGRCSRCASDANHVARATSWAGSPVPDDARAAAPHGWWTDSDRAGVHDTLDAWLRNNLGRGGLGPVALYLWGLPGRGKTRAAADVAYRALVVHGLVGRIEWTSQAELRELHDQRWRRETERGATQAEVAASKLERLRHCGFLVVDDLFTSPARGAFAELLADLVRDRLNDALPTVYTSNHPPQWTVYLETDGRIESRWSKLGRTVEVTGGDWRLRQ